jgi:F-box and WD-40 domain protein 1/11
VDYLPSELLAQALSHLDPNSLMQSELVSRAWKEQASSRHVWRAVFRRAYSYSCTHSMPSKMKPSAGLGKSRPNQDWKRMFLVRRALERRWKEGKAAAIYLHGHKDSVYCAQFDEYVTHPRAVSQLLTLF